MGLFKTEEVVPDIAITRTRYEKLILAEQEARIFKELVERKLNEKYPGISSTEIEILADIYHIPKTNKESEGDE